jgi:hypothetical protein
MVVELSELTPPPRVRAKHGAKVYARLASKEPGAKFLSNKAKEPSLGDKTK